LFSTSEIPVSICKKCSFVYLNPRHTDEWYKRYYNSSHDRVLDNKRRIDIISYEKRQYNKGKSVLDFILKNSQIDITDMRVLEVGCTSAGILRYFRDMGATYVAGVDPESEYVDYATNISSIDVFQGFIRQFNSKKFDLIILRHVVEHLADPLGDLKHIHSLLKDNGIVFVETPSLYSMDIASKWCKNFHVEHPNIFSDRTLELLLVKSGYKIVTKPLNGNRTHLRFLAIKSKDGGGVSSYDNWRKNVIKNFLYDITTPMRALYYNYRNK